MLAASPAVRKAPWLIMVVSGLRLEFCQMVCWIGYTVASAGNLSTKNITEKSFLSEYHARVLQSEVEVG
jgi:hypothetical protein